MRARLFTDGGSRGNPGPSGSGAVLFDMDGGVIAEATRYLGITTNNVAEYTAILIGLEMAEQEGVTELEVYMDSELAVKQLNGVYRVKNPGLAALWMQVRKRVPQFTSVRFSHVRRAQNVHADALVNKVLDANVK